jgi:peptidyl-prolyl cis-trans isomerase A (cyclophilin A)
MEPMTQATLNTNKGPITIELYDNHAPKTVSNFVGLAEGTKAYTDPNTGQPGSGPYYDGVVFHRVIDGFMIQGGDPTGTGTGGPGYKFADEFHPDLHFGQPYLLAMANAGPGTNGSQFFITVGATAWLRTRGLHVPGDVAVIGSNDAHMAAFLDPPLASIDRREPGAR